MNREKFLVSKNRAQWRPLMGTKLATSPVFLPKKKTSDGWNMTGDYWNFKCMNIYIYTHISSYKCMWLEIVSHMSNWRIIGAYKLENFLSGSFGNHIESTSL